MSAIIVLVAVAVVGFVVVRAKNKKVAATPVVEVGLDTGAAGGSGGSSNPDGDKFQIQFYRARTGFDGVWMIKLCTQLGKTGKTDQQFQTATKTQPQQPDLLDPLLDKILIHIRYFVIEYGITLENELISNVEFFNSQLRGFATYLKRGVVQQGAIYIKT